MSFSRDGAPELLITFQIAGELFGVEVMKVQEVTGAASVMPVPLAPGFVCGLINLRGQLATAFGLRQLFGLSCDGVNAPMSVVCRLEGNLVSLMVDSIGDVVEANRQNFESPPETIPENVRQFIKGIYKMNGTLLSLLDLEKLARELSPSTEGSVSRAS